MSARRPFVQPVIRRIVAEAAGSAPDAMPRLSAWVRSLSAADTGIAFEESVPRLPPGDLRQRAEGVRAALRNLECLDPRENPTYAAEADATFRDVLAEVLVDWTMRECRIFTRRAQRAGDEPASGGPSTPDDAAH